MTNLISLRQQFESEETSSFLLLACGENSKNHFWCIESVILFYWDLVSPTRLAKTSRKIIYQTTPRSGDILLHISHKGHQSAVELARKSNHYLNNSLNRLPFTEWPHKSRKAKGESGKHWIQWIFLCLTFFLPWSAVCSSYPDEDNSSKDTIFAFRNLVDMFTYVVLWGNMLDLKWQGTVNLWPFIRFVCLFVSSKKAKWLYLF